MSKQSPTGMVREVPRVALSIDETATALGLGARTVEDLARRGELPAFRVGKRWLFGVDALRRWANEQTEAHKREGANE